MFDILSIGDTSHNVYLEMDPSNVHLHTVKPEPEEICFTFADKIPVKSMHDGVGGNSANSAVAFGRLGFSTGFYTQLGDDAAADTIVAELERNGVSTEYVVHDHNMRSNYSTVINLNAERTILVYHLHRHYSLPKLSPAGWVYLSSMGEGSEIIFEDLAAYVREQNVNLLYQPGTFQLQLGSKKAKPVLQVCRILAVNKEEAELYLGKPTGTSFRELLDGILALGPKIALITDGPAGAYCSDGRQYLFLGIIKEAPRIEATGAGDSFTSGFMAAIAAGEPLGEAMRWGQCESSSVIQFVGPQAGLLHRKELVELLVSHSDLQPLPLEQIDKLASGA